MNLHWMHSKYYLWHVKRYENLPATVIEYFKINFKTFLAWTQVTLILCTDTVSMSQKVSIKQQLQASSWLRACNENHKLNCHWRLSISVCLNGKRNSLRYALKDLVYWKLKMFDRRSKLKSNEHKLNWQLQVMRRQTQLQIRLTSI